MSKNKFKPLADRVLVEPITAEEKTKSGLYIPDSAKEKPIQGTIVSIGNEELLTVREGDKVLYTKNAGTVVDKYLIMREIEILAIINK